MLWISVIPEKEKVGIVSVYTCWPHRLGSVKIWMWTLSENGPAAYLASGWIDNTLIQKYFLDMCLNPVANEPNGTFTSTGGNLCLSHYIHFWAWIMVLFDLDFSAVLREMHFKMWIFSVHAYSLLWDGISWTHVTPPVHLLMVADIPQPRTLYW